VLFGSDPSPGAVLTAPPAAVSLTFSESVIPAGKGIKVYSPAGHQVAGPARVVGHMLTAPISATESGTYVVIWQALAADTHPSRGAFSFVVGQASANPYLPALSGGEIGTASPLGFVLQALARWIHFLGFALAFGTIAYQVLMTGRDPRLRRFVVTGVVLLIAAEPVALVAQLASLSFDGDTAIAVLASGFGRLLGLRLGIALLVWALLALESAWPVLAMGGAMALIDGASAHAIPGLPGAGLLLDAIHIAAMGIWVGGLTAFLFAPDRRFRPYAIGGLAVVIGSGLVLAVAHLGSPGALIATAYGWVLVVKAAIVALLLSFPLIRRLFPSPSGGGQGGGRVGAAAIILVAAAVLVSLPPPR